MKPRRIQLSRKKGWRKPANTIVVARPTRWGNPFRVTPTDAADPIIAMQDAWHMPQTRESAVNYFRRHVKNHPEIQRAARKELRGKHLACWCPIGEPCHADVLLEIANR